MKRAFLVLAVLLFPARPLAAEDAMVDLDAVLEQLAFGDGQAWDAADDKLRRLCQENGDVVDRLLARLKPPAKRPKDYASDPDRIVRHRVASLLGRVGAKGIGARVNQVVDVLESILCDGQEHEANRSAAGSALGMIGAAATPALARALKHEDSFARGCAASEMGQIDLDTAEELESRPDMILPPGPKDPAFLPGQPDPQRVAFLIDALDDADDEVRSIVISSLRNFWRVAEPEILAAAQQGSLRRRLGACSVLASIKRLQHPELLQTALEGLRQDDELLRNACQIVEHLGPAAKEAVPLLQPLLQRDEPPHAVFDAIESLGEQAAPLVPDLVAILKRPTRRVEFASPPWLATVALGRIGKPARPAIPVLVDGLEKGGYLELQKERLRALISISEKINEAVLQVRLGHEEETEAFIREAAQKVCSEFK